MTTTWNLNQTKQCRHCPWRKDSDLSKIPDYNGAQHAALRSTIIDEDWFDPTAPVLFMACHNGTVTDTNLECVGWLNNQREANNIGLRLRLRTCANLSELEVVGEQFEAFDDTLPQNR